MDPNSGYLETMTPLEKEVMLKVKDFLKHSYNIDSRKIWNRWNILRFCRARKFDFDKIVLMIHTYFKWCIDIQMNQIGQLDMQQYELLKTLYAHGYYNVDLQGRPIYIEQVRFMKPTEIFQKYTDEDLTKYYVQSYERLLHVIFPECSRVAGKRIDKTCAIMDLKDVNLFKLFSGKIKAFLNLATDIAQNYYPEVLGSMYIINSGYLFSGIWMIVKGWLDIKTQQKINIITGKGHTELKKVIAVENLPVSMGGTCERELTEDHGPWEEELKASHQNKTVFHRNHELVSGYYWDEEEKTEEKVKLEEEAKSHEAAKLSGTHIN